MMLTPVRLKVSSRMRLSSPVSPPSPSFKFSRKNFCSKTYFWSSIHSLIHCSTGRVSSINSGAMKPSSDIVTLKNTLLMFCSFPLITGSRIGEGRPTRKRLQ